MERLRVHTIYKIVCIIPLVLLVFFVGYETGEHSEFIKNNLIKADPGELSLDRKGLGYVEPLLACNFNSPKSSDLSEIYKIIEKSTKTNVAENKLRRAGIYFRDLHSGAWTGYNEQDRYAPGSLLKVGVLMAYLKESESNPKILNNIYTYTTDKDYDALQSIKSTTKLISGQRYPVRVLLESMIIDSDNNATAILINNINRERLKELYSLIEVPLKNNDLVNQDFMTVKAYALLFRMLYRVSYLSEENSVYALKLLTRTTYNDGLRKGIPKDFEIAHKFGERTYTNTSMRELHECGIIYHPDGPYLLCIMTEGNSVTDLQNFISNLGAEVDKTMAHIKIPSTK